MTYHNVIDAIGDAGIPCQYGEFKSKPPIPFAIVVFAFSTDLKADNQNYSPAGRYQVELYNTVKDPAKEKIVENVLRGLRLPFAKSETKIESEGLYEILYEIQILGE